MPPEANREAADGPAASPPAHRGEPPRLAISLGQFSSAGRKSENQDFHGALQPEGVVRASKGIAVAIADGISTSRFGAEAAETAVKSFLLDYYCTPESWSVQASAERVIAATNSWLHGQNGRPLSDEERERGMVCTFSALVLKSRTAHLFHIGDARIARLSGGTLEPLTEAHRVSLGGGESYLGRALGVNRHVEIDHRRLPLAPGDLFVLTTDGVHDHLGDRQLAALVLDSNSLDAAAEAVARAALAAGSEDNLTVQLVRVESLPTGDVSDLIGHEAALPPAPLLAPGQTFSGYTVLRELHAGSRSHVYLARDEADGRRVALKVLSSEHGQDPAQVRALLLEEWAMRRLDHPHLLKAAPQRGPRSHAFIVSEFLEGRTLHQWLLDNPRPDLATVRTIVGQIASGLHALHRRGMLHRDLRPHNVLIDVDDTARIIDFGSVRVEGVDELGPREIEDAAYAGTVQYSAPELYLGEPASVQSDLYSLAAIAYRMLTRALPYGTGVASARTRAAQRKLRYAPAAESNPAVPDWVDAALARALAVDPRQRYAELSEFTFDLANPNAAPVKPEPRPLLARGAASVWRAIAAALALALLVAILTRPDLPGRSPASQQETKR
uniref:bifunctional protein-serine/threonine kinase/phosphatase n=1 Tax=Altererythrobacter segetis TaxID=1104773 RepID=UPI001A9C724B|nr:bifunctional protein-serine/threonine kinase/phosphatase [Altererythrobacter segetis]